MTLNGRRVAILVEDLYQDQEVWYPYYRLKEAGVEVVLVGTGKSEYKGKYGYPVKPDTSVQNVSAKEFDAVIVPGGFAPDLLRRDEAVIRLVREANEQGLIIAAICHAGWVLISADVFKGKTATCFSAIKDDVKNAGADYVDREVVRDGNLITSRKPDDLPIFMRTILGALTERQATMAAPKAGPAILASAQPEAAPAKRRRRRRGGRGRGRSKSTSAPAQS